MIRSLAQAPPGKDAWEELCAALDGLEEGRELERALGYLEGALRRWPQELRVVPPLWRREMLDEGKAAMRVAEVAHLKQLTGAQLRAFKETKARGMRFVKRVEFESFSGRMDDLVSLLYLDGLSNLREVEFTSLRARLHTARDLVRLRDAIEAHPSVKRLALRKTKILNQERYGMLLGGNLDVDALTIERSKLTAASMSGVLEQMEMGLKELDLGANELGDEGWEALAHGNVSNLRSLRLDRTRGGDAGAKALVARGLGALEHLSLLNADMTEVGFAAIMGADLENLRELEIDLRGAHEGLGQAWAAAGTMENLRRATLRFNSTYDFGLCEAMSKADLLQSVRDLHLTQMTPQGLAALLRSPALEGVERLTLDMVRMTHDVWEALVDSEHLGRMSDLTISRSDGSDVAHDGFGRFCKGHGAPRLQHLRFVGCKWNTLERLANSDRIGMLTSLALENSEFDATELGRLFGNEQVARMERFVIHPAREMTKEEADACMEGEHHPSEWSPPFCALKAFTRADAREARAVWRRWWHR